MNSDCNCDYDALTGEHESGCPFIQPRSVKKVPLRWVDGEIIGTAEVDEATGMVTAQITNSAVAYAWLRDRCVDLSFREVEE